MKNNWLKIGGNYWELTDLKNKRRDDGDKIFTELYHSNSFYPIKVHNIGKDFIEELKTSNNCFRTKKDAQVALKEFKQGKRNIPYDSHYDGLLGEKEFIPYQPE